MVENISKPSNVSGESVLVKTGAAGCAQRSLFNVKWKDAIPLKLPRNSLSENAGWIEEIENVPEVLFTKGDPVAICGSYS